MSNKDGNGAAEAASGDAEESSSIPWARLKRLKDSVLYLVNLVAIIIIAATPSVFQTESDTQFTDRCQDKCTAGSNWQADTVKDTCDYKHGPIRILFFVLYSLAMFDSVYVLYYYCVRYGVSMLDLLFKESHNRIYMKWSGSVSITVGVIAGIFNLLFSISTNDSFITDKCQSKCANTAANGGLPYECDGSGVLDGLRIGLSIVLIAVGGVSALLAFCQRHINHTLMLWSVVRWAAGPFPLLYRLFYKPVQHKSEVLRMNTMKVHEKYLQQKDEDGDGEKDGNKV